VRRNLVAFLGTLSSLVLLFAYPTSHNASMVAETTTSAPAGSAGSGSPAGSGSGPSSGSSRSSSGTTTSTGDAVTTRWGIVQVRITVRNGKITASEAVQYPDSNGHDRQINAYALPILGQEAVAAQSARIDSVSGATVTSDGYLQSLQSAIDAATLHPR
jgi:uncharacterized protein with FMN-binding domain